MAVNKIVIGHGIEIDLTNDTVTEDKLLKGITAHRADGEIIEGSCTFDVDSSEATARIAEVLEGQTFAANGQLKTGTMPNIGKAEGYLSDVNTPYSIPMGFHDGSGSVAFDINEVTKLIPENIKAGIRVFGVEGTYGGEEIKIQTKEVTPTLEGFSVRPDEGFDYLSEVTVAAIPVVRTPNAAGGITITIG